MDHHTGETIDVPAGENGVGVTEHHGAMEDVTGEDFLDVVGRWVDVGQFDGRSDGDDRLTDPIRSRPSRHLGPNVDRELGFGDRVGPSTDGHARPGLGKGGIGEEADKRSGQTEPLQRRRGAEPRLPADVSRPRVRATRRRSSSCRLMPRSMRGSVGSVVKLGAHLVAGILERTGTAPSPDEGDILVAGVVEPVPVAALGEDHVSLACRLHTLIRVDLTARR